MLTVNNIWICCKWWILYKVRLRIPNLRMLCPKICDSCRRFYRSHQNWSKNTKKQNRINYSFSQHTQKHFHVRINSRAVRVCCNHVAPSLCDSPTVLPGGTVKLALSPSLVSIKREHPLHILEYVTHRKSAESASCACCVLFVGLKVPLEMFFIMQMRIVSKLVRVSEYIIEVEAKMLMEVVTASSRTLSGERTAPHLIVLLSPIVIC